MKRKVRREKRQSEFRTVRAECGKRGGKWPWSSAPSRERRGKAAAGDSRYWIGVWQYPLRRAAARGRVKQGGNTMAGLSSSLSERFR